MDPTEKGKYIHEVDAVLRPLGFKKPARSQEWSKVVATDRHWVHVNFGLSIVNVSLGVEYMDIRAAWAGIPGAVFSTFVMLSSVAGLREVRALDASPAGMASDIQDVAPDTLNNLGDRDSVIQRLKDQDVKRWPVPSFSHRIRLAPLLMAQAGLLNEAVVTAELFLVEAEGRDQLLPRYSEYVEALQRRVSA